MIDLTIPHIPNEVFGLAQDEPDLTYHQMCDQIWQHIYEELIAPEHQGRSHHNVGTYDKGCRGPLCTKANREHPRRKVAVTPLQLRQERIYDPVMEYFHTVIKYRIRNAQQDIIQQLKETSA